MSGTGLAWVLPADVAAPSQEQLEQLGYRWLGVYRSLEEACSRAGSLRGDVLAVWVGMECLDSLSEISRPWQGPILLISRVCDEVLFRRMAASAADACLVYPCSADQLDLAIRQASRRYQGLKGNLPLPGYHMPAQRMIGQMAAGIAHHYNNLLTIIDGYSRLMRQGMPEAEARNEALDRIIEASGRAARLTAQLLEFSHSRRGKPVDVDAHESLTETLEILRPVLGVGLSITTDLDADQSGVYGDPLHLREIWAHLLVNARDAMPDGGRIELATRNLPRDQRGGHGWIEITLRDTGIGMDAATAERALDPFFTTKPVGKGVGLGLCTVFYHVDQMGGSLHIDSHPGDGTTVTVVLPTTDQDEATAAADPGKAAAVAATVGATVLLVDDEQAVLALGTSALRHEGFRVIGCSSGREALDRFRDDPDAVDLAIVDMVMPGINGLDTIRAMLQIRADLTVILTSGCGREELMSQARGLDHVQILGKPWGVTSLLKTVRSALASRGD